MNLFLPEDNIYDSVRALDDSRLNKQILECKTMLDVALGLKEGYAHHPVVAYYKDYPWFVCEYAIKACEEYLYRFNRLHSMDKYFNHWWFCFVKDNPKPFYCEGAKTDPNCIRTTENTVELFRAKLCRKWDTDKYRPRWTNREPPEWYRER